MELYTELLILFFILLLLAVALFLISLISHRRHVSELRRITQRQQSHNAYLTQAKSLSEEAAVITSSVRSLIQKRKEADNLNLPFTENRSCLCLCDSLLQYSYTENPIIDALLFSKKTICEKQNIQFELELHGLPQDEIPEVELTALLGNLLDNAIEAAAVSEAPHPEVFLYSELKKSVWIVRVRNTKNPSLNPVSKQMQTTKKNQAEHGLGLPIIRQLTDQYHGSLDCKDLGEQFEITAMLVL
ncbi:GHKL domain-containing protein [bacterium 210820-DFI.6.37]|nr:GHKL domain-containing protein [bacterium 210820-DFI.6.37]